MRAKAGPAVQKRRWLARALCHCLSPGAFPAFLFLATTLPVNADEPLPRNDFGGVGLIEMPSARMAPDGELSAGASFFQNTQHYNLGFQILPWLEGSFRYSGLQHFDPAFPVYYDRSFAVKARLWDETDIFPAVAVGIDDLVGTGVYSGEYFVASKRFGDFDASIGVGWGRLASTDTFENPFTALSNSLQGRATLTTPGGTNFNVFFHGHAAGIFGGVAWHTPIDRLSLIAEYSSDEYTLESSRGSFTPRDQLNFGASYQLASTVTLGANWLYGRSFGGSISFQFDPTTEQYPEKLGPEPPAVTIRSNAEQQQALQTMLQPPQARAGHTVTPSADAARAASRDAFVDALWREGGNLRDVRMHGRLLLLTADGAQNNCAAAARLVQAYADDIDAVALRGTGRTEKRCIVPRYSAPILPVTNLGNINEDASPSIPGAGTVLTALTTIDAASPFPEKDAALRAIRHDADQQHISIEALSLGKSEALVYYANRHYFAEADALDRLIRVLMADAPPTVEKFRLIAVQDGVPQQEFDVLRGPEERSFTQSGSLAGLGGTATRPPPLSNPVLAAAASRSYPRFSWDVFPQFRQELFDPNNPFAVQFLLGADGKFELLPGLSLNAEVETSLYDNFNKNRPASSSLPHVRSDFLQYFAQGKTGIGELDAQYRFRLAPDVFAVAKAGYLESMFAGVGGEILWRPEGQRWALGGDLYDVRQRDFDRLFGLRDYHALTGHISIYYASPWYDLNFAVRAGQYLAGDGGLTFEATRRFSTGVEIGAFVTKTNVSATQFGEGSFDKGIIIRIPLGWIAPIETQGQLGIDLRPVQRDGGQRLVGDTTLYGETARSSIQEILSDITGAAAGRRK